MKRKLKSMMALLRVGGAVKAVAEALRGQMKVGRYHCNV